MFSAVKAALPLHMATAKRYNVHMRLDRKDWVVSIIVVALFAAVPIFQENTYLSGVILLSLGCIISYILLSQNNIIYLAGLLLLLLVWSLIGGTEYYVSSVNFEKEMRMNYGRIYPSNEMLPDKRCAPGDDIILFSGPNSFQATTFPYTFLYIDGAPIISLGREGNAITMDYLLLNDTNGENIVHIDKDVFWIKPTIERMMVPDRSKLAIKDHSGNTALVLWFLNSTHIFIAGKFVYHGFTVDIGNSGIDITLPSGQHLRKLADDCFYNHQLFVTTLGLDAVSPTKGAVELKLTP
jgi:hypothetical protein